MHTPGIRALIQTSNQPTTVPARRFGLGEEAVARWEHSGSVENRSTLRTRRPAVARAPVIAFKDWGRAPSTCT